MNRVVESMLRKASAAVLKDEITDEEKAAICWAAGVPMKLEGTGDPGVLRYVTREKCSVVKINGKWNVVRAVAPVTDGGAA